MRHRFHPEFIVRDQTRAASLAGPGILGLLALSFAGITACAQVTEFENVGTARILGRQVAGDETGESGAEESSEGPERFDFVADEPLRIEVVLGYSSNGCAREFDAHCEASLEDGTIHISAVGSFEMPHQLKKSCSAVSLPVQATCSTPPLPVGTYVFRYGSYESAQLMVPSRGEALAIGQAP